MCYFKGRAGHTQNFPISKLQANFVHKRSIGLKAIYAFVAGHSFKKLSKRADGTFKRDFGFATMTKDWMERGTRECKTF